MTSLILEGETLGQKREHYNKLVNEAIINKTINEVSPINFDETDIDNLFKIDIACNNRNVNYILEVLKCDDMLYVSRAIKQSKWLLTDDQYSNIINPKYLFDDLFPQMISKAKKKLLLQIRLHLKDEKRVESFCSYFLFQDLQAGLKWLSHCSFSFTEAIIEKYANDIPKYLRTRLCKQSINFVKIFVRNCPDNCLIDIQQLALFLSNKDADRYFDFMEHTNKYHKNSPRLSKKQTEKIMKKHSVKILNNLEHHIGYINICTFTKYLKENEVKDLLFKIVQNDRLNHSVTYDNIQYFINCLPSAEKFEFVKELFIDQDDNNDNNYLKKHFKGDSTFLSVNAYDWYKYAPFNIAFQNIKKFLEDEFNTNEVNYMLTILLQSAGNDLHNIKSFLQYYCENHMNNRFEFKVHIIKEILDKISVYNCDLETWSYLNYLFTSIQVYEESNNDEQSCIQFIIVYNLVHNKVITKIIQEKFIFNTLQTYKNKLKNDDKDKVFNYLYNYKINELNNLWANNEGEFNEAFRKLEVILILLKDWSKNLSEHEPVFENIKKLLNNRDQNSLNIDISKLYNIEKSWKILFFNESILMNPSVEVVMNALKHGPELIDTFRNEVFTIIYSNQKLLLRRFLNTLRMFWAQSLAIIFKTKFINDINKKINFSSTTLSLSLLLPQKELLKLIHRHISKELEIDCNESKLIERQNLGKILHLARPQVPLSTVLLYAKEDNFHNVLPSINAILYNMSLLQMQNQLDNVIYAPISIQMHIVKTATSKFLHDKLQLIFKDMWRLTKDKNIRSAIIKQTFKLLCKQKNVNGIERIWNSLTFCISNLTADEDTNVYVTLCRINEVPSLIRASFWMTSYNFFKALPKIPNCSNFIDKLKGKMTNVIEFLNPDFMATMYFDIFDKNFTTQVCGDLNYLAIYLLSAKSTEIQNIRYNKVMLPIIEKALASWDVQYKELSYTKSNLQEVFRSMLIEFEEYVLNKNMTFPIILFSNIYQNLNNHLPIRENYVLLTSLKLSTIYIKILDSLILKKSKDSYKRKSISPIKSIDWKMLHIDAALEFGKVCVEYLKEDINIFFPTIYLLFANSLQELFHIFYDAIVRLSILKIILEYEDFVEGYLLVLKLIPNYVYEEDEISLRLEILNKIKSHPSEEVKMHYWFFDHLL